MLLLPHHLDQVIRRYLYEDNIESLEAGIQSDFGLERVQKLRDAIREFQTQNPSVRIVLYSPDSLCQLTSNPICDACSRQGLGRLGSPDSFIELVKRTQTDFSYKRYRQLSSVVQECFFLLAYGLEPQEYSANEIILKVESLVERVSRIYPLRDRKSNNAFALLPPIYPRLKDEFSILHRLFSSEVFLDLIEAFDDDIPAEKIKVLEEKYDSLFASLGKDSLYPIFLGLI
jgi:hypothetical protein